MAEQENSESQMQEQLDPKDKELFLKSWNLKEGELTDQEILMAIKLGQL